MARQPGQFRSAWGYYWARWSDGGSAGAYAQTLHDIDNNKALSAADATDTTSIALISADLNSRVHLDRAATLGDRNGFSFYLNAAGGLTTQCFYVNNTGRALAITGITELHSTAETATGTSTAVITHDTSGLAPGTGTVVMTNTFNLKGTANTQQSATLLAVTGIGATNAGLILNPGDSLSVVVGGAATITALAGVVLTVYTAAGAKELTFVYNVKANGSIATQTFGLANRDLVINGVYMAWSAAATNAGTVTIDVTIDTGTTAPGGGTTVLAAAQSVKGAANIPVNVPLTATVANLKMSAGNRIAIKTTGTLTALAGLVVVVSATSVGGTSYIADHSATFSINANGTLAAAQGIFIADRDYEVVDASATWATAGSDGGTVSWDVTIDKGVVAPGAGLSCLAAATSVKTTANTTSVPGVNTSRRQRLMSQGDLLTFKLNGTLTALAGVTATVELNAL